MHDEQQARRYQVTGIVHGVGYRFFTQRVAERMGVAGYVRNLPHGRVEVYAVGPAALLTALREELERGPEGAIVSSVTEEEAPLNPRFSRGFSIEFGDP